MAFTIDANYSVARLVRCRHENRFRADPVHVDADARLHVVQVNVTVLGDQVGDTVLVTYLNVKKVNCKLSLIIEIIMEV